MEQEKSMLENQKIDKAKLTKKQPLRPTIGLMAASRLDFGYTAAMLSGIADMAGERDANLICFAGDLLRSPYKFDAQRNVIYNMINAENVDGLIVLSGILCTIIGLEALKDFLKRYQPLPMVSIAVDLAGIPSVLVDNEKGFRDSIVHLIEIHGCRRIAFIRGPENNPEAELRYRVFTDVMSEYGLHVDNDLVVFGNFFPISGVAAIHQLLSQKRFDYSTILNEYSSLANISPEILHKSGISIPDNIAEAVNFDAVVAADDNMAVSASTALQAWGVRVPDVVAVTGFDDVKGSKFASPPLTTVQQPLYEQGQRAVEILLAQISGEQVPQQVILPTQFVVRQSCGCISQAEMQSAVKLKLGINTTFADSYTAQRETIISEIIQAMGAPASGMVLEQVEQLVDAFSTELKGEDLQGAFLSTLGDILSREAKAGENIALWYKALSAIRDHLLPYLGHNEALLRAENLLYQSCVIIGETTQRVEAYQRLQEELQAISLFEVGQALITSFDLETLSNIILQELPKLNILSCFISLYEKPEAPDEWARLILAYNEKGPIQLEASTRHFPSRQLVPAGLSPKKRRYTMVVDALYFREEQIGFALFEMSLQKGIVFETLRGQIRSSLKGMLLFQERKQAQEALEIKAKELARSNEELEQFAYMASHDLQEPLRKVIFFSDRLKIKYSQMFDDKGRDYFERIIGASNRMQAMINDLLSLSRVTTHGKPLVSVNLRQIAREAVSDLEIRIKKTKAYVEIGDLPAIQADPIQIRQLFANLIGNALKFHREGIPPSIKVYGEIFNKKKNKKKSRLLSEAFETTSSGVCCRIFIQDNGIGFDEKYIDRIFQPFQRLHTRDVYKGSGIGLAICCKIVERHRGKINAKSKTGQGTIFIITLPVNEFSN